MILLCEDGSLRIYMANVENTSYWLQPSLQPSSVVSIMKPVRKRKTATISKAPPGKTGGGMGLAVFWTSPETDRNKYLWGNGDCSTCLFYEGRDRC